jgi:hypothetical protein
MDMGRLGKISGGGHAAERPERLPKAPRGRRFVQRELFAQRTAPAKPVAQLAPVRFPSKAMAKVRQREVRHMTRVARPMPIGEAPRRFTRQPLRPPIAKGPSPEQLKKTPVVQPAAQQPKREAPSSPVSLMEPGAQMQVLERLITALQELTTEVRKGDKHKAGEGSPPVPGKRFGQTRELVKNLREISGGKGGKLKELFGVLRTLAAFL